MEARNQNYAQISAQLAFKRPRWAEDSETTAAHNPSISEGRSVRGAFRWPAQSCLRLRAEKHVI